MDLDFRVVNLFLCRDRLQDCVEQTAMYHRHSDLVHRAEWCQLLWINSQKDRERATHDSLWNGHDVRKLTEAQFEGAEARSTHRGRSAVLPSGSNCSLRAEYVVCWFEVCVLSAFHSLTLCCVKTILTKCHRILLQTWICPLIPTLCLLSILSDCTVRWAPLCSGSCLIFCFCCFICVYGVTGWTLLQYDQLTLCFLSQLSVQQPFPFSSV